MMFVIKISCICFGMLLGTVNSALFRTNTQEYRYAGNDVGEPLFLTPYLEAGEIEKARSLSRVLSIDGVYHESFSGYFTVNKTHDSNLFFWFWPAQDNPKDAPVLLWLQGGPGGSSLFSLFVEIGAYYIDSQYKAHPRQITWNKQFSLIYIDNPVQTGYSFTHDDAGFARNQVDVARDLYSCLTQFFTLFPDFGKNDFYLTGESYAGKYIPAIGYKIHSENPTAQVYIRLKGAAIGDGFTDPPVMIPEYPDYMYNIGILDEMEREVFRRAIMATVSAIKQQQWLDAFHIFDKLFNGDIYPFPSYYTNVTGSKNYDNFLRIVAPASYAYYEKFVTSPAVRRAIHVGNLTYNNGVATEKHLLQDMLKSEAQAFTVLINNYRLLVYSGQLDIIVAAPLTEAFLQAVPWKGLKEYKKTKKHIWRMNSTDVSGYVRNVRDFYQVIVRGGGHILPHDQPARCLDMLTRFIYNQSLISSSE